MRCGQVRPAQAPGKDGQERLLRLLQALQVQRVLLRAVALRGRDPAVVAALGEVLADIEVELRDQESKRGAAGCARAEDLRRSLEASSRRIDKLMILYEDDAIDIDEFRRRRKSIDALASQARDRLQAMESEPPRDPVSAMSSIKALMATLADDGLDAETRNIALKKIVERIDYAKEAGGTLQLTVTLR